MQLSLHLVFQMSQFLCTAAMYSYIQLLFDRMKFIWKIYFQNREMVLQHLLCTLNKILSVQIKAFLLKNRFILKHINKKQMSVLQSIR